MEDLQPSASSQRSKSLTIGEISHRAYLTSEESENEDQGGRLPSNKEDSSVTPDVGDEDVDIKGIQTGSLENVVVRCCMTDNRVGRIPKEKRVKPNRFIKIADQTGMIDIYINSKASGIEHFDLKDEQCTAEGRCFANIEVLGTIAWGPQKHKKDRAQFYLNEPGMIKEFNEPSEWNVHIQLGFPSSEICRIVAYSPYARYQTTTGFCGRVEMIKVHEATLVLLSVSDAVGYTAMEFDVYGFKQDSRVRKDSYSQTCTDGDLFVTHFKIQEGTPFFVSGKLSINEHASGKVAVLRAKAEDVGITMVNSAELVGQLTNTSGRSFSIWIR